MTATHSSRMLILGSGPAGLSAAIYRRARGMAPIVVQGIQPGGQLTITTDVENYPGFREVIQGPWLMEEMQAQAEHVGAQMMWDHIVDVDLAERPFPLTGDSGTDYFGDTLVIATGAQAKWLGLESEHLLQGKGVSACATCDGFFYRGKKVVVIGGGNTAVEEALYLTNHSHDVTLDPSPRQLPRREDPAGAAVRASEHQGAVEQGGRAVSSAAAQPGGPRRRRSRRHGDRRDEPHRRPTARSSRSAISRRPNCSDGKLPLDEDGYLLVEKGTSRTSIPGVFAAGDVTDKIYRQAVTAAGMGCMAALDAEKFLAEADFQKPAPSMPPPDPISPD